MSIIYSALNRLEVDGPVAPAKADKTVSPRQAGKPMSVPVKVLASALMLVFVGTSLMVWYSNEHLSSNGQLLARAVKQPAESRTTEAPHSPVTGEEDSPVTAKTVFQKSETTTVEVLLQPAAPTVPKAAAVLADMDKESTKENQPPQPAPVEEKAVAAVKVKPEVVKTATAKPKPKTTAPAKAQPAAQVVPAKNTDHVDAVNETLERARIALAGGQYQQALSVLETLSPMPENRVDVWLIKGSAHLGLGQFEQADKALAVAQQLAPNNVQIAVQRAILKQETGDHATALEILQDAAALAPDIPEVFLNLGYSQQALGAVHDARHSFRIFLRVTEGRSLYAAERKAVNDWLNQFYAASY